MSCENPIFKIIDKINDTIGDVILLIQDNQYEKMEDVDNSLLLFQVYNSLSKLKNTLSKKYILSGNDLTIKNNISNDSSINEEFPINDECNDNMKTLKEIKNNVTQKEEKKRGRPKKQN
jgi:hypothetical protein